MISREKITEIFCSVDDFCIEFVPFWQKSLLDNGKKRIRASKMSLSEVMTIQVLFICLASELSKSFTLVMSVTIYKASFQTRYLTIEW